MTSSAQAAAGVTCVQPPTPDLTKDKNKRRAAGAKWCPFVARLLLLSVSLFIWFCNPAMVRVPDEDRAGDELAAVDPEEEPLLAERPRADRAEPEYQPLWVRLACILIDFFTQVYDQIRIVPEIALFLRSICSAYYGTPDPPAPPSCKILPVQRQLANLRSWKAFFDGVASRALLPAWDVLRSSGY